MLSSRTATARQGYLPPVRPKQLKVIDFAVHL